MSFFSLSLTQQLQRTALSQQSRRSTTMASNPYANQRLSIGTAANPTVVIPSNPYKKQQRPTPATNTTIPLSCPTRATTEPVFAGAGAAVPSPPNDRMHHLTLSPSALRPPPL